MSKPDDSKANNRRGFFRSALSSLFEAVDEVLDERGILPRSPHGGHAPPPPQRTRLRPPGAASEAEFLQRCQRGGECAAACPVGAIQVLYSDDPDEDGTPYVVASEGACVLCDEQACMTVCPSGALAITPYPDVNMGIAVFDESSCLRNFGDSCAECVDRCPLGEDAIRISDDRIDVQLPGCVGCGVCEYYCPTSPRAIQIVPE